MNFLYWVGERSLAKLFFLAVLALPVLAFLGYSGWLSRRRNKKETNDSKEPS